MTGVDPPITIRRAVAADADRIGTVHVASWHTTYPGIVDQSYIDNLSVEDRAAAWRRRLTDTSPAVTDVLVAEQAGVGLVGFASGGPIREPHPGFDAELHAIYMLAGVQRRGLGRRLVHEWSAIAVARGLEAAVVRVLAANPARAFYERLGARWLKDGLLPIAGQHYPEVWLGWSSLRDLGDESRGSIS